MKIKNRKEAYLTRATLARAPKGEIANEKGIDGKSVEVEDISIDEGWYITRNAKKQNLSEPPNKS